MAEAKKMRFILDDDDNATCPVCGCTEVWNIMDNGYICDNCDFTVSDND